MKGIKRIITCGHSLGGALSQMIHIQLHGELETLRDLGLGHENLLNVTFASPMVGNHCLRDNLGDIAGRMYHFVEAGDIVPGALFTHHLYQRLALYDWQLDIILWLAGCKSNWRERCNTLKEDISKLKTENQGRNSIAIWEIFFDQFF